jgi:tRNA U34 5-methylaminomethyl-2-thiouridine-forming methyltransferase MnmC
MSIKIITTEDGSHSLFDENLNETYHSTRGALGESLHVFIKEGLEYCLAKQNADEVHILEVGFGTGLNAFLTAKFADKETKKIHFTTLEPYPINSEVYEKLNYYTSENEKEMFLQLHSVGWEKEVLISEYFSLEKSTAKLEDFSSTKTYHLIYFDAFAPSKQPEVWSLDNLKGVHGLLEQGGILTTYCAQGQFKRNLIEAGFEVETLPGAMGKKEMVRALKL